MLIPVSSTCCRWQEHRRTKQLLIIWACWRYASSSLLIFFQHEVMNWFRWWDIYKSFLPHPCLTDVATFPSFSACLVLSCLSVKLLLSLCECYLFQAKLAKLRREILTPSSKGGGGAGEGFDVTKSGDSRVGLVGFPSVGKSTLLNKLTGTFSEVRKSLMFLLVFSLFSFDVNKGSCLNKFGIICGT